MKKFRIEVEHDNGNIKFTVPARNIEAAKMAVMIAENCPPSAIVGGHEVKTIPQIVKPRRRPYIGITAAGEWLGFGSYTTPTPETTPEYVACIGPFTTRRAQLWALQYGKGNPHFQTVRDAERLSKAP